MKIKLAFAAALLVNPALANCRISEDPYGGHTTDMRCDDGYEVRGEPDSTICTANSRAARSPLLEPRPCPNLSAQFLNACTIASEETCSVMHIDTPLSATLFLFASSKLPFTSITPDADYAKAIGLIKGTYGVVAFLK